MNWKVFVKRQRILRIISKGSDLIDFEVFRRRDFMDKQILDVCCGSRMFWFDKHNEHTVFMDNRILHDILCDGRKLDIEPDIVGDFRNIPFDNDTFHMVVFDPPHLLKVGESSWLAKNTESYLKLIQRI